MYESELNILPTADLILRLQSQKDNAVTLARVWEKSQGIIILMFTVAAKRLAPRPSAVLCAGVCSITGLSDFILNS